MWNYGQQLQLGNIDIANIITGMTYEDENGNIQFCDPLPFHPIHDLVHVNFMRARFQRHKNIAMSYYIGITKSEYGTRQALLRAKSLETRNNVQETLGVCHLISYYVWKSNIYSQGSQG